MKITRIILVLILTGVLFIGCNDSSDSLILNKIEVVSLPLKTSYLMGEDIDLTGMVVQGVYSDGSERSESDFTTSKCDTFTSGSKTITVTLSEKTASFNISVENTLVDTGLPVIYITTADNQVIDSKENYVSANMIIKKDNIILSEDSMRIRGRGHASWEYPKKPYKIKLDKKSNLLDMGEDKDWVLLANYCDKTLMRTSIAFKLSELMNFPWTPKARYVELVINGEYLGNYQLVEGIKRSTTRVNISEEGFLVEKDNYYLEESKYFTTNRGYGYSFKNPDPDELTEEQLNDIKDYINEFETVLDSEQYNDANNGYYKYIDVDSFSGWYLFQQIIANIDTNILLTREVSSDSKLFMGPVWDFEWSMGIGWYDGDRPRPANYFVINGNYFYFDKLLQDAVFKEKIKQLWNANHDLLRPAILAYIDTLQTEIMKSQKLNFKRWDILNIQISVGGIPLGSFENEVACDKQFFINHMDWLDTAINGL